MVKARGVCIRGEGSGLFMHNNANPSAVLTGQDVSVFIRDEHGAERPIKVLSLTIAVAGRHEFVTATLVCKVEEIFLEGMLGELTLPQDGG